MLRSMTCSLLLFAAGAWLAWFPANSLLSAAESSAEASARTTSETRIRDDVKKLASDDWEGRGLSTQGINQAADFIAGEFKRLGYNTELFDGTPFQKFSVTVSNKIGKPERNVLTFEPTAKESAAGTALTKQPLVFGKGFTPLSIGGSGKVDLPIAFVGYGITAKDDKYDDYEGIDVKGKAVIILRHEPQQKNPHSPFDGTQDSMHAPLMRKVSNAYQHGAAAVLFVTDEVEIRGKVAAQRKRWQEALEKAKTEFDALAKVKSDDLEALDEERIRLLRVIENLKTQGTDLGKEFDPLLPFERGDTSESRRIPVVHVRRLLVDQLFKATGSPRSPSSKPTSTATSSHAPSSCPIIDCRAKFISSVSKQRSKTLLALWRAQVPWLTKRSSSVPIMITWAAANSVRCSLAPRKFTMVLMTMPVARPCSWMSRGGWRARNYRGGSC